MLTEYEEISLISDLPAENLHAGDRGVVVFVYPNSDLCEVEFFDRDDYYVVPERILRRVQGATRPKGHNDVVAPKGVAVKPSLGEPIMPDRIDGTLKTSVTISTPTSPPKYERRESGQRVLEVRNIRTDRQISGRRDQKRSDRHLRGDGMWVQKVACPWCGSLTWLNVLPLLGNGNRWDTMNCSHCAKEISYETDEVVDLTGTRVVDLVTIQKGSDSEYEEPDSDEDDEDDHEVEDEDADNDVRW